MSILAVKIFFQKIWIWCKIHWELVLGISLGLFVLIAFQKGTPDFSSLYRQIIERKKEEIDAVESFYEKEIKLQEEASIRALDAMKQVEKTYESRKEILDKKKKKEVEKLIKESKRDPELLSRRLAELTGASFVILGDE